MNPYYEKDGITIYHGDSLLETAALDIVPDVVLTDPPYGVSYFSKRRKVKPVLDRLENDTTLEWLQEYFVTLSHKMAVNSAFYTFCSWHHVEKFKQAIIYADLKIKNLIVWNKNNHGTGDLYYAYAPKHELVWYAMKGKKKLNRRPQDVLNFPKVASMVHATQKPLGLLEVFLSASMQPSDLVFDPFMGVGSTLVAAKRLGFQAVGIELEERYCEEAARRLENGLD